MPTSEKCLLFTLENVELTAEAKALAVQNPLLDEEPAFWDALRGICQQCPKCLKDGLGPDLTDEDARLLNKRLAESGDRRLKAVAHRLRLYREVIDIMRRRRPVAIGQFENGYTFMVRCAKRIADTLGKKMSLVA